MEFPAGVKFQIGILDAVHMEQAQIVRVPWAYPAYVGSYGRDNVIRAVPELMCSMRVIFPARKVSGRLTQRWSTTRTMEEIELDSGGRFERAHPGNMNRVIK
jgi:hypothetical protein